MRFFNFQFFNRKPILDKYGNGPISLSETESATPLPDPELIAPKPTVCDGDVLDHVILRYLLKTLKGYNEYSISINGIKLPQIEKEQTEIARLRVWADAQLMEPKVRKAYTKWLDHFWRGSEEARAALSRRAPSPSEEQMRIFREHSALRDKMVEQCMQTGAVPVPPR